MSEQTQNNSSNWIDKLNDLEQLPGEALKDNAASWEKLYSRVKKHPAKKLTYWYSAVAALILITLMVLWLVKNEKPELQVKINRQQTGNPSIKHPSLPVEKPYQTKTQRPVDNNVSKTTRPATQKPTTINSAEAGKVKTDFAEIPSPVVYDHILKPDSVAVVAIAPLRKKMRVVHINEVEEEYKREQATPVVPDNLTAGSNTKEVNYTTHPSFFITRNASDDIVKIKLSPSN